MFALWDRIGFPVLLTLVGVAAAALAWFTWAKLGDVVIDVGREMEIPWKISQGEMLYRDVAYNYGPLSPYVNALLLKIFGIHLGSLVFGGFLSAGIGAILIYRVCRRFLGPASSVAMIGVFLLECVFQHYFNNGSFNFILPYSFPAVHSILFTLGALLALFRYLERGTLAPLVWAGVLGGLSALCKIEIAAALFATLLVGTLVLGCRAWVDPKRAALHSAAWLGPFLLVTAGGFLPFVFASSWDQVVRQNVFKPSLVDPTSNLFFLRQLGLDNIGASLKDLLQSTLFWAVAAAVIWWAARLLRSRRAGNLVLALVVTASAFVASWFAISVDTLYRCLPLVAAMIVAVSGWRFLAGDRESRQQDGLACAFGVLAFLCLGRILLNAGTYQYGFFMALPALLLLGVFLGNLIPGWLRFDPGLHRTFVFLMLFFVLFQSARNFTVSTAPKISAKTLEIAGRNGRMSAFPNRNRYQAIREVMEYLESEHPEDMQTLLVIPEGAGINFLAGRWNPTSYDLFLPHELNAPGVEERLIDEIRRNRVEGILLIDRHVGAYGFIGPGIDYAKDLMTYIRNNYEQEKAFGANPYPLFKQPNGQVVRGPEGGAILFKRKE